MLFFFVKECVTMRWKRTNITNEQGPALKVKLTVEGKDAVKLVKKHFLLFLNLFFFSEWDAGWHPFFQKSSPGGIERSRFSFSGHGSK